MFKGPSIAMALLVYGSRRMPLVVNLSPLLFLPPRFSRCARVLFAVSLSWHQLLWLHDTACDRLGKPMYANSKLAH
jgi:hypothetical protein